MDDPTADTSFSLGNPPPDRDDERGVDPRDHASRRARVALRLALLGLPTAGITAIAGLGLGLAGLADRPRGRSIAAVGVSLLVIVGWIGVLAGVLEAMHGRFTTPPHILNAERRLAHAVAEQVFAAMDPSDPQPISDDRIRDVLHALPDRLRRFDSTNEALALQPDRLLPGVMARWWVAPPVDPGRGSTVTEVVREPGRTGLFMFAVDGREVLSFGRAWDPTKETWDDQEAAILEATRSAAEAIVATARDRGGELPDALEAARIIESLGPGPHPVYRPRPGGVFDLVVPGGRRFASYAAFGGLLVPVIPE